MSHLLKEFLIVFLLLFNAIDGIGDLIDIIEDAMIVAEQAELVQKHSEYHPRQGLRTYQS
ncbi:unnamed protein product [Paramecium octaurelia]|uniref:Uncharacterized protein n=1 Tax=Paramecium octaurelia TaxID=43137 RepID=A0A8S1W0P1_PAROT|nr:unnamed protein product [Paramecium octaurelia]